MPDTYRAAAGDTSSTYPAAPTPGATSRRFAHRLGAIASVFCLCTAIPALAEDHYGSLLFQNDAFVGHDGGGYTNGTYFSSLRVAGPGEGSIAPGLLTGPFASFLGVSQATLTSTSFGQSIVTPSDIGRRQPDPRDAPYAGALVFRSAQVAVQDEQADMVAVNLGVIGPASGAKQTQRFIHRLTGSTAPQGWDTQVSNRPLLGLERARSWRFTAGPPPAGQASGDMILAVGGVLGNLESSAGTGVLLRYGTGLARSFPTTMGANGRSTDPFLLGSGWFAFAGLSADHVFSRVGVGGEATLRRSRTYATLGLAYGWASSSLTLSVQSTEPIVETSHSRQTFGSITYLVRLQ